MDRVSCQVTPQEAELCRNHHRALAMLVYFKQTHGDQPFACDPEAIGPRLCMNHKTARHERDFLLKAGLLEVSDSNLSARRNPGRQPKAYILNSEHK
jgi:hypothetical protein